MDEHAEVDQERVYALPVLRHDGKALQRIGQEEHHPQEEGQEGRHQGRRIGRRVGEPAAEGEDGGHGQHRQHECDE